ncbi:hypothetical protein N9Y42_06360 [Mariniblastus sp.]|nr:hypothetical protein [Mariniblastus sp.]
MLTFFDWFPLTLLGLTFTFLGCVKLYGIARGIEGGARKPFSERLCGT